MRPRSETIGQLGRSPARASKQPPLQNDLPLPQPGEPAPERGILRRWIHGALFDNVGLKFLSIVLAITVFLLVNTDRDREITARVGVSYATLPDDKALVSERLDEVHVTIKGPWQRLRRFDGKIDPIDLDLRRTATGEIVFTPDMIHLPTGLEVVSISPRSVRVAFDRRVEKVVEVAPQIAGRPKHGYVVSDVKAAPATIKVRGAEAALAALSSVRTRELSVDGLAASFTAETDAVAPEGVKLEGSPTVVLHITIDEELVTRKMPGLVVGVRGDNVDPSKWTVTPSQVEITLTGTLLAVEKARAAVITVVKPGSDGKQREAEVIVDQLPPGIGVKVSPERVKVMPRTGPSP